jgi:hypothetical protein
VNKFANYFSQSFNRNSISSISIHNPTVNQNVLYVDRVTEREIVLAISKLKNNETCGPDQIPSFLIRDCRHLLAPPLKVIFNSIINPLNRFRLSGRNHELLRFIKMVTGVR